MSAKYFRVFMGISLLSVLYGFDTIKQSQDNQIAQARVEGGYEDALRVNTAQSREVLAVATRVIQAASHLQQNPLDNELLQNMVQTAFDNDQIQVSSLVNMDYLIGQIRQNQEEGHRLASDAF